MWEALSACAALFPREVLVPREEFVAREAAGARFFLVLAPALLVFCFVAIANSRPYPGSALPTVQSSPLFYVRLQFLSVRKLCSASLAALGSGMTRDMQNLRAA
jgi:hypothetical protein